MADLIAAIRLPEGSFRARCRHRRRRRHPLLPQAQGRRARRRCRPGSTSRRSGRPPSDEGAIRVNRWFARHPDFVLGHACPDLWPVRRDLHLPAACRRGSRCGVDRCHPVSFRKPSMTASRKRSSSTPDEQSKRRIVDLPPMARQVREGSYFIDAEHGADADGRRRGRSTVTGSQGPQRRRHPGKACPHHPQADPDPRRRARGAEGPGARPALEAGAGQAAHRLVELRARLRPDQPHHGLDHARTTRPARSARRIAVRTCSRSSTIPIAGWSPRSRTTTSRPTRPGPGRSSPSG